MLKNLPKFKTLLKGSLAVAFITLAIYGGMVSYYYLFPEKERPPIVIPLENLDLSFNPKAGPEKSTEELLEGQEFQSPIFKENPELYEGLKRDFLSLLSQRQGLQATSSPASAAGGPSKVEFTGDVSALDFSKEGLKNALPETLREQITSLVSQVKPGQKKVELELSTQESIQPEPSRQSQPSLNSEDREVIKNYLIASSKIKFPEDPMFTYQALTEFKQQDKKEKFNQIISQFQQGREKLAALTPPSQLENFHKNSLQAIDGLILLLQRCREEPVMEVMESKQAQEIRSLTYTTIWDLEELVSKYNLKLPQDVIPAKNL